MPPSLYNTKPGKYMVSTWGRIYNTEINSFTPKELTRDRNMYIMGCVRDINNNEIHFPMHQLIAKMFIMGRPVYPDGKDVIPNHIDGVKWHNEPYNLEWTTLSGNTKHADDNNLIARPYGEDNGNAALTDEQYHEICRLTEAGLTAAQINKRMNVGFDITNIAQKIRNGTSESLIAQQYDFSNIPRNDYRKFTEDQVRFICQCLQDHPGIGAIPILQAMGYDTEYMDPAYRKKLRDTISTIKRRVSYVEIGKDYNF